MMLSSEANMGYDKLYLLEEKQMRNNYRGHNTLGAGYLARSEEHTSELQSH